MLTVLAHVPCGYISSQILLTHSNICAPSLVVSGYALTPLSRLFFFFFFFFPSFL